MNCQKEIPVMYGYIMWPPKYFLWLAFIANLKAAAFKLLQ